MLIVLAPNENSMIDKSSPFINLFWKNLQKLLTNSLKTNLQKLLQAQGKRYKTFFFTTYDWAK
jgi:hypothetical protein